MPVRILEDHVVNQIAAGEVVERPASVLRELFQNALDAGATAIDVQLRNGGMALVRVVDNGTGMNRTDAMMSLERHATSKIHQASDLQLVQTLGFRGEALPSIAAVSRFELKSRTADSEEGTRVRVEGGTLRDVATVGCAVGTEVDVRSVFFNLPARRKFLRTRTTELNHCLAITTREILLRPELELVVLHEDREILHAPRAADVAERVQAVLGDAGRGLLPIDTQRGPVRVVGLVSPVGVNRSTAAGSVFLYVNGRYVQDPLLRRAIYEAYRDRIPRGRYPLVVLNVLLPPEQVDVNVHPPKTEVRFTDPREVGNGLTDAVRERIALAGAGVIRRDPSLATARPGPLFAPISEPLPLPGLPVGTPAHPDDDLRYRTHTVEPDPVQFAAEPEARPATEPQWRRMRVLGGVDERWLVCEAVGQLVAIDVPAAHRALWIAEAAAGTQPLGPPLKLLAPARVQLSRADADAVEAAADALAELGVLVGRFSPLEVAVRALPEELGELEPALLVEALAAAWARGGRSALSESLWGIAAQHHPFPDDAHAQRTLLAVLDEAGVDLGAPVSGAWTAAEIARKIRGSSS